MVTTFIESVDFQTKQPIKIPYESIKYIGKIDDEICHIELFRDSGVPHNLHVVESLDSLEQKYLAAQEQMQKLKFDATLNVRETQKQLIGEARLDLIEHISGMIDDLDLLINEARELFDLAENEKESKE